MDGKEKEPGKPGKKKRLLAGVCTVLLLAAAGAGGFFLYWSGEKENLPQDEMPDMDLDFGTDVVTAGGSTSIGMQEESFDLNFLDTELEIEEVYLSSQDEVEAGAAILKLTEDSVKTARRELEEKATQADLDYRQALLDGEEEKITAQQTLDTSLLNGTYASYTYEESLKEYETQIESLEEQIEEAQELVEEYAASIESDYYYTYYEVAEKEEALNTTFAALMQLYEEWDVEGLEDQYPSSSSGGMGAGSAQTAGDSAGGEAAPESSGGSGAPPDAAGAPSDGSGMGAGGSAPSGEGKSGGGSRVSNDSTKLTVYDMLDQEVQENEAAYEEALENYEDAKATAVASYAQAQDTYQTEIDRINDEISVALNAKEEADENLREFEETIGDGYLYTTSAGTVMMVNAREETSLSKDGMVLAYSNPDTVTVTASVGQEDIASVGIGDKAVVAVSDYGTFDASVSSVDPVSASSSRSSVTYSVVVELTGDVSGLSQNLSANVYFGVTTEDLQAQEDRTGDSFGAEGVSGNDMPAGMDSISENSASAGREQ